jgi:signal transduction histidine kinase
MAPMPSSHRNSDRFRQSIDAVARGRYLLPIVLALGIVAMAVNESTYQHSHRTLSADIALTDARIQAAETLQLFTDAGLYARSYILSGSPDDAVEYRKVVKRMHEVKQKAFDLVAEVDPEQAISVKVVEMLVAEQIRNTDDWVELVSKGDHATALNLAITSKSRERRDLLRDEFSRVLKHAGEIQQDARFSLYNALSMSRMGVHLLALVAMLSMFFFRKQLRTSDQELAQERYLLADRVRERTAELTEMAHHLVYAREDERAHIARELHDEMGGLLTAMKLDFARLRRLPGMPEKAPERMASIEARLNEGIALKRRLIENLRPSSLDQLGLVPALDILCQDMAGVLGTPVHTVLNPVTVDKKAELSLYRIAQESLTNAAKYAGCTQVEVRLEQTGSVVRLRVRDDGQGFQPDRVALGRHGLVGMRVRLESHGGRLLIDSAPGRGTLVTAELPALTGTRQATPTPPLADLDQASNR